MTGYITSEDWQMEQTAMGERVSNETVKHMAAERGGDMIMWRSAALDLLDARRERDKAQETLAERIDHVGGESAVETARRMVLLLKAEIEARDAVLDERNAVRLQLTAANKALDWVLSRYDFNPTSVPDDIGAAFDAALAAARAAEGETPQLRRLLYRTGMVDDD